MTDYVPEPTECEPDHVEPCPFCDGHGEHVHVSRIGDPQRETSTTCRECGGTGLAYVTNVRSIL